MCLESESKDTALKFQGWYVLECRHCLERSICLTERKVGKTRNPCRKCHVLGSDQHAIRLDGAKTLECAGWIASQNIVVCRSNFWSTPTPARKYTPLGMTNHL